MTPVKHLLKITLLAMAFISLGLIAHSSADTIKVPKDKPVFVLDLPDGWTHTADKDGDLSCEPGDKSDYSLQVILTDVTTKADMKKALPILAKSIGSKAKMTEIEVGDVEDSSNGNKVPFTGVRADGKLGDVPLVIILHAFEPVKGKWYVLFTVGTDKSDKAHEDDYNSIYDSIQTLK